MCSSQWRKLNWSHSSLVIVPNAGCMTRVLSDFNRSTAKGFVKRYSLQHADHSGEFASADRMYFEIESWLNEK